MEVNNTLNYQETKSKVVGDRVKHIFDIMFIDKNIVWKDNETGYFSWSMIGLTNEDPYSYFQKGHIIFTIINGYFRVG